MNELTTLPTLAVEINKHHEQAQSHAKAAIEHALDAGDALIKAKEQVKHGEWLSWLQAKTSVSERMAQRYMKVAINREQLESKNDTVSDLTISGALELLSEPNAPAVEKEFDPAECARKIFEGTRTLIACAIGFKKEQEGRTGVRAQKRADDFMIAWDGFFEDAGDEIRTVLRFEDVVRKWKKRGVIFTQAGLRFESELRMYEELCELGRDIVWIDRWNDKQLEKVA